MPMSYNAMEKTIEVARRFIRHAELAQRRLVNDKRDKHWAWGGTKETGQARRTSLDLTRALAKLRKY